MKNFGYFIIAGVLLMAAGCRSQQSAYDREDPHQAYERYINSHIFAACTDIGKPYATYSLANLNKRPTENHPYYKVTFIDGPCKGKTYWTKDVILKTEPAESGFLQMGAVVLRNYDNPAEPDDKSRTARWHKGVVSNVNSLGDGIVTLSFPRDSNDFNAARERIYTHNVRYILEPTVKDVRTFL